jgi:hypothetical protein
MRLAVLTTCSSLTQDNSVLCLHGSTTDVERFGLWLYYPGMKVNREDLRDLHLNDTVVARFGRASEFARTEIKRT